MIIYDQEYWDLKSKKAHTFTSDATCQPIFNNKTTDPTNKL